MRTLGYRPDIDGLRAVAVLFVVLYHLGLPYVTGGYVGVDVFFVISGFLITSIILKDIETGVFTLTGFWERRLRRILPPLLVVLGAVVAAGWLVFLPGDYEALGKHILTQSVFGQNILLYKESGYFDTESHLKPLLHTWSLAVEEQFYLLFPLALFYVWKKAPRYLSHFLVISWAISFVLCLIVMVPNKNLAFFMLPTRGWELLTGSVLAYYSVYRGFSFEEKYGALKNSLMGFAGLVMILVSVFLYTGKTVFPGVGALLPCMGTAMLVMAGQGTSSFVSKILSIKPLVFIGLVSYSFYLWHWPAYVCLKYIPFRDYAWTDSLFVFMAAFALSVLTWKYVEQPIRSKRVFKSRKSIFVAAVTGLGLMAFLGCAIWATKGMPVRLNEKVSKYAQGITDTNPWRDCDKRKPSAVRETNVCQTNPESGKTPSFLLWGDSMADAIAPAFFELSRKYDSNGYVLTHHGCAPIVGYANAAWSPGYTCQDFNTEVMALVKREGVRSVFMVSDWVTWMEQARKTPDDYTIIGQVTDTHKNKLANAMDRTLNEMLEMGIQVYFVINNPSAPEDPPRIMAFEEMFHKADRMKGISRQAYLQTREADLNPYIDTLKRRGIVVLDPADLMCGTGECLIQKDGYSLYYNAGHIGRHGALYLMPMFEDVFKRGL